MYRRRSACTMSTRPGVRDLSPQIPAVLVFGEASARRRAAGMAFTSLLSVGRRAGVGPAQGRRRAGAGPPKPRPTLQTDGSLWNVETVQRRRWMGDRGRVTVSPTATPIVGGRREEGGERRKGGEETLLCGNSASRVFGYSRSRWIT